MNLNHESILLNQENVSLNLKNDHLETINLINENALNVEINLEENSSYIFNLFLKEYKELNFLIKVKSNSFFKLNIADISNEETSKINFLGVLEGENSDASIHVASLARNNNYKKYVISFDHNSPFSTSKIDVSGVSKEEGNIKVEGFSHIKNNMIKSNASQKVRITLIDKTSKGSGNPILKIDCNDIKANHGCAIGSIKEDDLYYLLTRGLSLKEAKRLITLGYLLPITSDFDDKNKEEFIEYVGGNI